MSWNKKDEDDDVDQFLNLDKSAVLQQARVFNASPIKPRQCRLIIAKVLFLVYTNESLTTPEATELFFSITKLFQSPGVRKLLSEGGCPDQVDRQIIYLAIKELSSVAQDVIIITSSLTKDMQPMSEPICRPNAIRALCKIIEPSMLPGIERFLKAAIVDKTDPSVNSAALVSSYHLFPYSRDLIRRWSNEVQEALVAKPVGFTSMVTSFMRTSAPQKASSSTMAQYHALGLMAALRQHDRMATNKLIQLFVGGNGMSTETLRNPFAHCFLIRLAAKAAADSGSFAAPVYDRLCSWLRNRNDAVSLEAAKAICGMPGLTSEQVFPAVRALQQLLSSSKATLRFAAIRALNHVALQHATAMSGWKLGLDELISDGNRSVATFAITALLKVGTEATLDSLIGHAAQLMNDISDEFRVIVVEAIKSLGIKFPAKHTVLLNFLAGVLRDEGGFEFKRAVVDAIIQLTSLVPAAKEAALSHLCEFIEDCEFARLAVKVLHLLGVEGPKANNPSLYIRFVYNRVVLETAVVRAAAVSALARFGIYVKDSKIKASVRVLLSRCLQDPDDEVRDRAAWSIRLMAAEKAPRLLDEKVFHLATLEQRLIQYCSAPTGPPFDLAAVPSCMRGEEQSHVEAQSALPPAADPSPSIKSTNPQVSAASLLDQLELTLARLHAAVPETKDYGSLIKSSPLDIPLALTEEETEYAVQVTKHIFPSHLVFEFTVTNTICDIMLENLTVEMDAQSAVDILGGEALDLKMVGTVSVDAAGVDPVAAEFACCLKFTAKDCDPNSGEPDEDGFEDEYTVDNLKLVACDYMVPTNLDTEGETGFQAAWDSLSGEDCSQLVETFVPANVESLKDAASLMASLLSMQVVEGHQVAPNSTSHTMGLTGLFANRVRSAARIRMTQSAGGSGIVVEATVRSPDAAVVSAVMACLV
ncbi:coatomer subunit gamma [Massospora cicadina]|nr:coatomer subunit gamma [Massospora cicadina]